MVPVHTAPAFESPYLVEMPDAYGRSRISRDGLTLGEVNFPARPRFYDLSTADGVPYSKIAVLHGRDVLATTVLQTCIRYRSRTKTCQFCAIGQSLAAGRTVERKTPAQLAEVAKAAVELDGIKHMVMTTGTSVAASPGVSQSIAPCSTSRAALDGVRLYTFSPYPAASRLVAIGIPIAPSPTNPIVSFAMSLS